jgi:hypothetical protein
MPPKPLPERVLDRYLSRLVRVATYDAALAAAFLRVVNLAAAPSSLLAPRVATRVLAGGGRRRARGPVVPAHLPPDATPDLRSEHGRLAR